MSQVGGTLNMKEVIQERIEYISTGWRMLISVVTATVWITIFLMNIKSDVKSISGKVDAYHEMVQTLSNENDRIIEHAKSHEKKPCHDIMCERYRVWEKTQRERNNP